MYCRACGETDRAEYTGCITEWERNQCRCAVADLGFADNLVGVVVRGRIVACDNAQEGVPTTTLYLTKIPKYVMKFKSTSATDLRNHTDS